jgi:hypothetical protein
VTLYRGSCHCGRVAFDVEGELEAVVECNCSICSKKGYLHWIIPRDHFRLRTPEDAISTYTFNTGAAKHHFCGMCGVAPFYVPRSHPDAIDVNVRCLEGVEVSTLRVHPFDGLNWEDAISGLRGEG